MAHDVLDIGTDASSDRARFGRYGRLAPQYGAPVAEQVRAECDSCGSHLLALSLHDGSVSGTCPVCLDPHVTRVGRPHATA